MAAATTRVVGLTGGIATGKSRVAELLRELGAEVECSDQIVRELQAPGSEALAEIAATFGAEVLLASGELDRAKLGKIVFEDSEARQKLNTIMHLRVYRRLEQLAETHRGNGVPVVVLDIPLLLEGKVAGKGSGAWLPIDLVVLVYADEATQVERILSRDGLSRDEAQARVGSQMPIEAKRKLADVVVDNSGSWSTTEKRRWPV